MYSRRSSIRSFVFEDVLGSVFRFPVWWYGAGFMEAVAWSRRSLAWRWKEYGIPLWLRDFFVPMYGFHDWTSRLVSVGMRTVIVLARLAAFGIEALLHAMFLLAWLLAPGVFLALCVDSLGLSLTRGA